MAFGTFVGIGGMWDVAGNAGDVSFFECESLSAEFQRATVAVTDADFQTVMEVETSAWDIGYFPIVR